MKKGKVLNILAGTLDIVFALALLTAIVLSLFANIPFINETLGGMLLSFLGLLVKIGLSVNPSQIQILMYIFLGILAVIALLSLIFGSITVSKARKEPKKYYRGGSVITFAIFETIGLAILASLLAYFSSLLSIVFVSVFGLIVILRYVGIGLLFCGKKKYLNETPVA
jgi:hypothetical protein